MADSISAIVLSAMCRSRLHSLGAGLLVAASLGACRSNQETARPETVLTYTSPMWYEETARYFELAPDGTLAIYGPGSRSRLYSVTTGKEDTAAWRREMSEIRRGAFDSTGALARLGSADGDQGWYIERSGRLTRLDIPPAALPRWAPGGSRLAYFIPGEPTVALTASSSPTIVRLDGAVSGLSWAPAGDTLYAVVLHSTDTKLVLLIGHPIAGA